MDIERKARLEGTCWKIRKQKGPCVERGKMREQLGKVVELDVRARAGSASKQIR